MQLAQRCGRSAANRSPWLSKFPRCRTIRNIRHNSSIPQKTQNLKDSSGAQDDGLQRKKRQNDEALSTKNVSSVSTRPSPAHSKRVRSLHNDRDIIDPLSLENTLRAHQQANQDSIVVRRRNVNPHDQHAGRIRRKPKGRTPSVSMHLDIEREVPLEGSGQWEDYTGKPRALSLDWDIIGDLSANLKTPWMSILESKPTPGTSAVARLSEELRAADLYFTPSQEEWAAVNATTKQLENLVLAVCSSHIKLDVIGSRASGLATPLSDLDLNLVVAGNDPSTEPAHGRQVEVLANLFKSIRWRARTPLFSTSYFAARARVPIIVGVHSSGLEFQIQSASSCYGSLEVVRHLCAEYPSVRALFKIIKQLLKMRGLSDGALGGLTSYPLINMIAVSLKRNVKKTDPFDFGTHLVQFLEYWSTIDTYTTGVTHLPSSFVKPPSLVQDPEADSTAAPNTDIQSPPHPFTGRESSFKAMELITADPVGAIPYEFDVRRPLSFLHQAQDNFMLTLHDPANPYNDLGRSAYAIKHIQATFSDCLKTLKRDMSTWDARVRRGEDFGKSHGANVSLLSGLIGGDYSLYNLERKRVVAKREIPEEHDPTSN